MTRFIVSLASSLLLASTIGFASTAAYAGPQAMAAAPAKTAPVRCHDAKGKFTKCPAAVAAKPKQCREKGKFVKCPA